MTMVMRHGPYDEDSRWISTMTMVMRHGPYDEDSRRWISTMTMVKTFLEPLDVKAAHCMTHCTCVLCSIDT